MTIGSDTDLGDFRNIENIESIYFCHGTLDSYYEILKNPGNNVEKITFNAKLKEDSFKKLIDSLESEHCKVNSVIITWSTMSQKMLIELLRVLHKKLVYLKINDIIGDTQ